jgi:hypothetical protein
MGTADREERDRGGLVGESPRTEAIRTVGGVHVEQLERWLCDPLAPVPSLDDLTSVFGLSFDAPTDIRAGALPHRLRFTLALLRDTFPDDGAARRWLRAPAPALGGRRPLDLLLLGEIERLEALAVGAWSGNGGEGWGRDDRRAPPGAGRSRSDDIREHACR